MLWEEILGGDFSVEVSSKRLVQPELKSISDGIAATKNLTLGFFAELIVMTLIFLCMYYK